jgi:trimeric autotransporter adhesin
MKLTRMHQIAKSLMTVGLTAAALGYVSLSYGQDAVTHGTSGTTPNYLNVFTGYKISSKVVLTAPGGTSGRNIAVGDMALSSNPTGETNTAAGVSALSSDTTGSSNTGIGWEALKWNTSGTGNTPTGWQALVNNDSASSNTAFGLEALHNTDIDQAGLANKNTAVGWQTLFYNQDGASNTAIGYQSCLNIVEGNNVTCIGAAAGPSGDVTGPATYIANVYGQPTTGTGNPVVCISSDGLLGTTGCASDERRSEIVREQQRQIQDQARISELEQRLSRLESLIGKK